MQKSNHFGSFVTLEGGEGSGKSSVAQYLREELSKKKVPFELTREPGGTAFAEKIRRMVLFEENDLSFRSETLLFLAARIDHIEKKINPALNLGFVVICERFHDSTIAYQGYGRGLGGNYIQELCELSCPLEPDFTLLFDCDPQIAKKRIQERTLDQIEQQEDRFHEKVRQGYLHLADSNPERIKVIDASKPLDQVLLDTMVQLQPLLSGYVR